MKIVIILVIRVQTSRSAIIYYHPLHVIVPFDDEVVREQRARVVHHLSRAIIIHFTSLNKAMNFQFNAFFLHNPLL